MAVATVAGQQTDRRIVRISLGERSYPVMIGRGLFDDPAVWDFAGQGESAAIVTNATVGPLYARALARAISERYRRVIHIELDDGEKFKDTASLNRIFDGLVDGRADRKTVVFALGGGVVGDMAGFAAACYMRGIEFVQVPTTLLAQVDSSVGGKTAINHPRGKNMIGAFHQPRLVVADLDTLSTLPAREFSAGLAEVIKYGPVLDIAFFDWIEANIDALTGRDEQALGYAIQRCCELKAEVVAKDEKEAGARAVLNFGHTFGHAIETGVGYGVWLHGEAVGCGMVMAAQLSARLGLISDDFVRRLTATIKRAGLPVVGPKLGADRYIELMRHDKKSERGEIRFVLIDGSGRAWMQSAPDELVRSVVEANC
ncbi:3-dehydroquinate synthase [Burkholderia sp. Bp9017]|uniref:3-dehydroquinate synthase n=1 Tax=Burkholderia TaxID=32008 RepID=UPI000F60452E|nr:MULTISPECIES: 3-dehydroquinate synthase [Burkholderia]RQZ20455.1 3-dehydroquinate synthase [Burkholderia sp. Bp9017]